MKKIISVILGMSLLCVFVIFSFARRAPFREVKPIFRNGIKYSRYVDDSILATDEKTGGLIWKRQIYVVKHIPELETDVQACFITKIEIKNKNIIITNEEGYKYKLNLNTLKVKAIKGSLIIDRTK